MEQISKNGDNREELMQGYVLHFPGMECVVGRVMGKGSDAIVYRGYYADHHMPDLKHQILIKELFPLNRQISRNPDGKIIVEPSAKEFYQIHRDSFENANNFHLKLLENNPGGIDSNLDTFEN